MDTVYLLQVITISITVLTLVINALITWFSNRQKNYNGIITNSRLDFMKRNRENSSIFIAEVRNVVFMLKCGKNEIDIKNIYYYFEQLSVSLKTYNKIDKKIDDTGKLIIEMIEKSIQSKEAKDGLIDVIDDFSRLINIYDDADWKFIKQQFNSTSKKSEDFDKICDEVLSKYKTD